MHLQNILKFIFFQTEDMEEDLKSEMYRAIHAYMENEEYIPNILIKFLPYDAYRTGI